MSWIAFTPTVFAITREEDRPELQKYRNHLKRLRRARRGKVSK